MRIWTSKELKYLKDYYPHEKTELVAVRLSRPIKGVYCKANAMGIKKSIEFLQDHAKSGRCRMVEHGKAYRFKKGQKPWNTGKKVGSRGRMIYTQFKSGHLPHNTLKDGAISIRNSKDISYKWIRVSLGRWELLHREVWRATHGEIPEGYNVQFKDRNTLNCAIENLHLVSKRKNMRQNTIHNYPAPIKKTIRILTKLNKAIANAQKQTQ